MPLTCHVLGAPQTVDICHRGSSEHFDIYRSFIYSPIDAPVSCLKKQY